MEPIRKRSAARIANRNGDLARIHIEKKALGLDDEAYRDLLQALTGKRSAGELSFEERARVAAHMSKLVRATKPQAWKPALAPTPHERRLLAEWRALVDAGAVSPAATALPRWLERNGYPAHTRWLSTDQLNAAIEQLKQWRARLK
jgi:phage gp16-like protein